MISNEFCPTIFEKLVSGVTAVVLSIVSVVDTWEYLVSWTDRPTYRS